MWVCGGEVELEPRRGECDGRRGGKAWEVPGSSRPAGFVRDANTGCGITCPPKQLLGPGLGGKASLPTAVVWRGGG